VKPSDAKKTMLINFSGGRTSAFMARLISLSPLYKDFKKVYVFANTGREHDETLDFVNDCDKKFNLNVVWVEAIISQDLGVGPKCKVVDYKSAHRRDMPNSPFDQLVQKLDIPNPAKKGHCTRDLKITPIHKYMNHHYGRNWIEAIGIRADEKHRIKDKFYPLADLNIDEQVVREFWQRQDFDLQLKDYQGNCDLCFKKSLKKKLTIIKEDPDCVKKWMHDENVSKKRYIYDRTGMPISELVKMSKEYFKPAKDKLESGVFYPRFEFCNTLDEKTGLKIEDLNLNKEEDCLCSRAEYNTEGYER